MFLVSSTIFCYFGYREISRGSFGAMLGPSGGHRGRSWGHLGVILKPPWCQFGAMLGPSWAMLGPILGHLGAMLEHLGPSWGRLGPSCGHHGPFWDVLGPSWGPSWAIPGAGSSFENCAKPGENAHFLLLGVPWRHLPSILRASRDELAS